MKRIFIAIKADPDAAFQRMYATLRSALGSEKITWVSLENIHLTLVFIGDTEEDRIKAAGILLKQKCTGFGEFNIRISGVGIFRNFNDPRVLWTGLEENDKLCRLNKQLNNGLQDIGFKIENRPFNPHITLGRIKSIRDKVALKSAISRYQDKFVQEVHVKEVILFESILKPSGPVYKEAGIFNLR
jgi:2'-5' RNA ligase